MIGIDPHKATHTAIAVDGENVIDEFTLEEGTRTILPSHRLEPPPPLQ
jgi:hypothetical protein